jgi:hypothetical protein
MNQLLIQRDIFFEIIEMIFNPMFDNDDDSTKVVQNMSDLFFVFLFFLTLIVYYFPLLALRVRFLLAKSMDIEK